jgi:hypothetical protein
VGLNLRSLNLIFYFIVVNFFDLSCLSNIFSYLLGNIFNLFNWNIFDFFNWDLFSDSVIGYSWYIFSLIFNGLIISNNFLFRNNFGNCSLLRNFSGHWYLNFFFNSSFNFFIFNSFLFNWVIFNSRFSFNGLELWLMLMLMGMLMTTI